MSTGARERPSWAGVNLEIARPERPALGGRRITVRDAGGHGRQIAACRTLAAQKAAGCNGALMDHLQQGPEPSGDRVARVDRGRQALHEERIAYFP